MVAHENLPDDQPHRQEAQTEGDVQGFDGKHEMAWGNGSVGGPFPGLGDDRNRSTRPTPILACYRYRSAISRPFPGKKAFAPDRLRSRQGLPGPVPEGGSGDPEPVSEKVTHPATDRAVPPIIRSPPTRWPPVGPAKTTSENHQRKPPARSTGERS